MTFDEALEHVLAYEGGEVNDPHDPGGHTNKGITYDTFKRWRRRSQWQRNGQTATHQELSEISDGETADIYRTLYWQAPRCDDLPTILRLPVFDTAVNMGVNAAVILLQKTVGSIPDGIVGPNTLEAAHRTDGLDAVSEYVARRALRYAELDHVSRYGLGWYRRLVSVYRTALTKEGLLL